MKLRYYLRGLGVGILVTAVLMSVTIHGKTEKLTDEEIIARAKELGMEEKYDSAVLSEVKEAQDESDSQEKTGSHEEPDNQGKSDELPISDDEDAEEDTDDSKMPDEVSENDTRKQDDTNSETVEITVQGGDGSMTVSRKLKDAGLIEDVLAYDKYLCNEGYDRLICVGTHSIPLDATEEEIAGILTTKAN